MSPVLRPVNIVKQITAAADSCVDHIVATGLTYHAALDVVIVVRRRGDAESLPVVVGVAEGESEMQGILERAYETVLTRTPENTPFTMPHDG